MTTSASDRARLLAALAELRHAVRSEEALRQAVTYHSSARLNQAAEVVAAGLRLRTVSTRWTDSDTVEVLVDGEVLVTGFHDGEGWFTQTPALSIPEDPFTATARAVATALGADFQEGTP